MCDSVSVFRKFPEWFNSTHGVRFDKRGAYMTPEVHYLFVVSNTNGHHKIC